MEQRCEYAQGKNKGCIMCEIYAEVTESSCNRNCESYKKVYTDRDALIKEISDLFAKNEEDKIIIQDIIKQYQIRKY